MNHRAPRMFLMAVHGAVTLGKPLPLRPSAFGVQVIPLAEVLPESFEAQRQCYSIRQMAKIAGVSPSTIKRAIKDKILKARKNGRRTVIPHEEAMAYLASLRPVDAQLGLDDLGDGADRTQGE